MQRKCYDHITRDRHKEVDDNGKQECELIAVLVDQRRVRALLSLQFEMQMDMKIGNTLKRRPCLIYYKDDQFLFLIMVNKNLMNHYHVHVVFSI